MITGSEKKDRYIWYYYITNKRMLDAILEEFT